MQSRAEALRHWDRDGLFMLLEGELTTWSYDYLDWKRTRKQGHLGSSLRQRSAWSWLLWACFGYESLCRALLLSHFLKRTWEGTASKAHAAVGSSETRCSCVGWESVTMEWTDFYKHGPGAAPVKVSEEEQGEIVGEVKLKMKGK